MNVHVAEEEMVSFGPIRDINQTCHERKSRDV
jgi:hypothetical protein